MSYTLAQLRDLVRQRADMESSRFIKDPELNDYINQGYGELYDLLTSRFVDYFTNLPVAFTITSGNTYTLSSDFYKLAGVDLQIDSDWLPIYPFNMMERGRLNSRTRTFLGRVGVNYKMIGNYLYMVPEDRAPGNYRIWYIPRYTRLVSDTDLMSNVMDFEEYVVVDAGIKCLQKEESDFAPLYQSKMDLKKRIEAMANNRDAGAPQTVTDVNSAQYRSGGSFPYFWW